VNNEELDYGLRARQSPAPVWSPTGDGRRCDQDRRAPLARVSMDELLDELAAALVETAGEISARIGFSGGAWRVS
jgi:hypothetical protein